jgi:hypothetical protein
MSATFNFIQGMVVMTIFCARTLGASLVFWSVLVGHFCHAQTAPGVAKEPRPLAALPSEPGNDLLKRFGFMPSECPGFNQVAANYQSRFSAPMRAWADQHTAKLNAKKVVYPFSGADIVTVASVFPAANHLILVADQWPDYASNKPVVAGQAAKECETMVYFARYGYFRTNDLEGKNSIKPRFIKLLTYNIALSDAKIRSIDYLKLGEDGVATVHTKLDGIQPDGLRFLVNTASGRELKIDYVRMDLSNNGLSVGKKFHSFMLAQMDDAVMIKSASHLLQKPYFSTLASVIADKTKSVVQDETGLDIEPLSKVFDVKSYGKFHAPHPLWHDSASGQRLIKYLSEQSGIEPLPFTIGYEKKSGSVLLVGARKVTP